MFRTITLFWLGLLTFLGGNAGVLPSAHAAEPQRSLVLILDGSGSMWGRIEEDTMKIEAAKSVMRDLLEEVPENVEIGLVAYGHRHKGDCADIETIADIGTEPDRVVQAVEHIQPRGKTPITASLRQSAGLVSAHDTPSTLVLVSDGIETCKGDPCALTKKLKAQNTSLIVHTVGFAVGDETAEQLRCVAEAGGGNYYSAASSAALREALFGVRDAVAKNEPAPAPPKVPGSTTHSKTVRKIGLSTIRLVPAEWVKMPVYYWKIVDPETGESKGKAQGKRMRVKTGAYQLVWRQSEHNSSDVTLSKVVDVGPGETAEVPIDTGIRVVTPESVGAPYRWWLRRPNSGATVAEFEQTLAPQVVPAGTYRLGWHQDEHEASAVELGTVEIESGKLNNVVIDHGFQVTAAKWVPGEPYAYRLIDDAGNRIGAWEAFGTQLVPPGTYQFEYQQSEHGHSACEWGTVTIPEDRFRTIPINSGVRFKVAPDTPLPYEVIFVDLADGTECVWEGKRRGQWEAIPVPPGRYRLDWHEKEHGSERMTLLEEFTIEPGMLVEFEM